MDQHEKGEPNDWRENRKLVERLLADLQDGQKEHDKRFLENERGLDRRFTEVGEKNERRFGAIELENAKRAALYGLGSGALLTIIAELIKFAFHKP